MAVLVIFLFMRDWRSTLISALALPTSVIATFFFMWIAGFTFNMMTLMALSLVIGILIDDAVVVRENIYRHMEQGADPMTAAQRGTSEIGLGGHGDDLHHPRRVPAGRFHDRAGRAVLQVVRVDDRLRRRDVAARRLHARPDAVVAVRPLHPARGAHADARRPAVRTVGPRLRRARPPLPSRARPRARPSVEDAGRGGPGVRRQPRHHGDHGHGVRAGRGPRRVPGHRRPAARYVVRRERGASGRDRARASSPSPRCFRSSAPLA